jgi:hypothetical protein
MRLKRIVAYAFVVIETLYIITFTIFFFIGMIVVLLGG